MHHQLHTLSNGMRVVCMPDANAETVTVLVASGTGSRFESKEENGMAHFLEHAVFKGTAKRKTARAITLEIDGVGGEVNAYTSKDHTAYYAKVHKRNAEKALDVVSDIFLNATLIAKEIDKERGAIIEEINMYADMPIRTVYDDFDALFFGTHHPLGRTILGPKINIKSFTRKAFLAYRARNYVAANSVICIAGAFDEAIMLARIKEIFERDMRTGDIPTVLAFPKGERTPKVMLHYKKTDQTHLVLGVPAYSVHHEDDPVVTVIASILGGGMSSRLFTEIREKRGLAYYVKADAETYTDGGYFYVKAGVSNNTFADAVAMIRAELKKIARRPVPAWELTKAKEYAKGAFALSLDTSDSQAQHAAHDILVRGTLQHTETVAQELDAVTAEDVRRVAHDLFDDDTFHLAAIGPHKNKKELLAILRNA